MEEHLEESPSSGLSFHLVSRPQSFEEDTDQEPVDVAVFGGRESLRRRALFEERLHAVENRERQIILLRE